jgi:hypothetical protein
MEPLVFFRWLSSQAQVQTVIEHGQGCIELSPVLLASLRSHDTLLIHSDLGVSQQCVPPRDVPLLHTADYLFSRGVASSEHEADVSVSGAPSHCLARPV